MRRIHHIFLLCLLQGAAGLLSAQSVSDINFYQEGKNAVITYSLDKQADISLQVSTDGGATFSGDLRHVSGDVGKSVATGQNRIVWDVLAERDKLVGANIVFRVSATGDKRTFTVNGVSFTMIAVRGGTFRMGATSEQGSDAYSDEKPVHSVTLSDYYIGETEVTQELWRAVMGSNPSYFEGTNLPVESVSWDDCNKFIRKLNALTGETFRLPTEAEWEFAARGGQKSRGYKYAGSNNIKDVAWFEDNSRNKTHSVKTKMPNELGLYDMSGNVWEWCGDWFGSYGSYAQTNPVGSPSGSIRVSRGGSWGNGARRCRVSYRLSRTPGYRYRDLGLRLLLTK